MRAQSRKTRRKRTMAIQVSNTDALEASGLGKDFDHHLVKNYLRKIYSNL